MTDPTFVTRLSDRDVARIVIDGVEAMAQGKPWGLYRESVVAAGVRAGRVIGSREALAPLDDAMRLAVDDELLDLVRKHAPGRFGWIDTLRRLHRFLDAYPSRGRGDDGGPGTTPEPTTSEPTP